MKRVLILMAIAAIAQPSLAQDASAPASNAPTSDAQSAEDGWDVFRDPARPMLMAYADFANGVGLAVRCVGRSYEAVITGLPSVRTQSRPLRLRFAGQDADIVQRWNVAQDGTVATSNFPARFARAVRQGGSLGVIVPDGAEDGRDLRYALDLPSSGAAVDQTLTACGLPTIDPRDTQISTLGANGLPEGLVWLERPRPQFLPGRERERLASRGFAILTCMAGADGRLRDCTVESEYPSGSGFGETAMTGVGNARLGSARRGAPIGPSVISFRFGFETNMGVAQRSQGLPHADTPN
ncbi:hypothetical protein BH10PSE1_BH10PSE1_20110 [soil metagenome]